MARTLASEATDRAPVAFWRPFPNDDQRAADFSAAVLDFQLRYDWDMCVITPAWGFAGTDFGLVDEWNGQPDGQRDAVRYPVRRSLDWTDLRAPDPTRGEYGRLADTVKTVAEALNPVGVPVVLGILSPLAQAARLVGSETLQRHLRSQPERFTSGLATLTEATMRFLDSIRGAGLSGIALKIEHADYGLVSEREYETFGLPGDEAVLTNAPKSVWLKIAHFAGSSPMSRMFPRVGANVLAWDDRIAEPDLTAGKSLWGGAIWGGVDAEKHLRAGTPNTVRDAIRDAAQTLSNRRHIAGCGRPLPVTVPHGNLRAARNAVERTPSR